MLRIQFIEEVDPSTLEMDIEKLFYSTNVVDDPIVRKCISSIEKGEYYDKNFYIDRFGCKLSMDDMSTGCKAAICVHLNPEKNISLMECGTNVRDFIIKNMSKGNIAIYDDDILISSIKGTAIDVVMDNYRFKDIDRLNFYLTDERPFTPNLSISGIEVLQT